MRPRRESVILRRRVTVECIPDGTPFELEPGDVLQIAQALGSHFTLVIDGQLVRLKGSDADAIGKPEPVAPDFTAEPDPDLQTRIWRTLATCYDPEIPVDIVELGLVYSCDIAPMDDGRSRVAIAMTLTAPGCGMGPVIAEDAKSKILLVPGVSTADVRITWDPPWNQSMISEEGKMKLGLI